MHSASVTHSRRPTRQGEDELDRAFDKLEAEAPDFLTRAILRLRRPRARVLRLVLGTLCIVAGLLWFLPVVGLEFLPVGLLLVAQDVPVLRRPAGRMTLHLLDRWAHLRKWWAKKRS